jgi:hypothetical protein
MTRPSRPEVDVDIEKIKKIMKIDYLCT